MAAQSVEQFATNPYIKGSNSATVRHQNKMAEKIPEAIGQLRQHNW